jgi:hypothetical protein
MKNIFLGLLIVGIVSACATNKATKEEESSQNTNIINGDEKEENAEQTKQEEAVVEETKEVIKEVPIIEETPAPVEEQAKGECIESPDECVNRWGIYLYSNGDCYQGYFKDSQRDGDGTLIKANGSKISAFWKNDEEAGERARDIGRTMEMKFDPIKLKQSCTNIINEALFGKPEKSEPKSNSQQVSLENCSGEDQFSKLLHKIATKLERSCGIAESFLSSADSFISELQNNLSKVASTNTPVEKKSELITTILNYFESDKSCIELGENKACMPLQTLLSDLVALSDTAYSVKLDFQGKNKLGEIEKLNDDLYQISIGKWERFINCKQEDEACDVNYSHRIFNIIFHNKLVWNMKVRTITLKEFLTETEYAQRQQ